MKILFVVLFVMGIFKFGFASNLTSIKPLILNSSWNCTKEGRASVCIQNKEKKKKNLIVWTIKQKGPSDTLEGYLNHLGQAKKHKTRDLVSEPEYVRQVSINGRIWIDSLHWQSEAANHYTRYLATTNDKVGVLMTFTSYQGNFQSFNKEIETIIEDLELE